MIKLCPFREADSPILYSWLQKRDYRLESGGFSHVTIREHENWFNNVQKGADNLALAVRTEAEDRLVGLVQLVSINRVYRNAELRIRLSPDELGQGYGTLATKLLCQHAFADLNLHRIYLYVRASNKRAVRCYEKVGFQLEGTLREHCFVDGEYDDFAVLGLLHGEITS